MVPLSQIVDNNPGAYAIVNSILYNYPMSQVELIVQELLIKGLTGRELEVFFQENEYSLSKMLEKLGLTPFLKPASDR